MSIMVVVNKSNVDRIVKERVTVRVNNKSTSWNLADKDIVDIEQYLIWDYDTALDMIEIKD